MDADNKGKSFGVGGYKGRIIFLGDGTEVLTDSDDTPMFDNADEDKDLESQVSKASTETRSTPKDNETAATKPAISTADSTKAEEPKKEGESKDEKAAPEESKKD